MCATELRHTRFKMAQIISKLPSEDWNLDGLVKSYALWLEVKAPEHLSAFRQRLNSDPEAARAEGVVFGLLRGAALNPGMGEVIGKGGVDFICEPRNHSKFAVEVTSLRTETVTKASGLQSPVGVGGFFGQVTTALMREAVNKATQLADYPMPRLLVIATEHEGASMVMGTHAAEELLTGTTMFQVKIGDVEASPEVIAPLKNSVFFRPKNDTVEPARQSISAILLLSITHDRAFALGLLHPAPAVVFDWQVLPRVHFVRLREWPITNRFGIEWVGPQPSPASFLHMPIVLNDADLKT